MTTIFAYSGDKLNAHRSVPISAQEIIVQFYNLHNQQLHKLKSIPETSILGAGCGTPTKFAFIKESDTVVDLGSGAGIDVFLAANIVKGSGRVLGIDMTDEMLEKAKKNAADNGYTNVEFRKADIEERIPVDENSVDVVISNCVINLTIDKAKAFREIYRILKPNGIGSMVISDLVTDKQVAEETNLPNIEETGFLKGMDIALIL